MHKFTKLILIPLIEGVTFEHRVEIEKPHSLLNALHLCWEPRHPFRYNYQRDKFLAHRDEFVLCDARTPRILLRRKRDTDDITLYKSSGLPEDMLKDLEEALSNNNYTVTVEDDPGIDRVDLASGMREDAMRVYRAET